MTLDDTPQHGPIARRMAVWANLIATAEVLLAEVERGLKREGFPPLAWYDVLLELKRAAPEGLRQTDLRERLLLAQYALSRLIDRIEAKGYVHRAQSRADGRAQIIRITDAGLDLQSRMWPVYREAVEALFAAKLTEPELAALDSVLRKIRAT